MMDKIKQLQQMKQQMDEVKQRLDEITVKGEAENGKVQVISTGNRTIKEVIISPELVAEGDAEQISELVTIATNRALESAENTAETEMRSVAGGMMGGLGLG
jgi:DNA-binding YbaB/EbfC family protein